MASNQIKDSTDIAGQSAMGEGPTGTPRAKGGNNPPVKSVRFSKTKRKGVYTTDVEYDNSGPGPYKSDEKDVHLADESADDRLAKEFGAIDADKTLDAGEKRRKKAKTSLGSSTPQGVE